MAKVTFLVNTFCDQGKKYKFDQKSKKKKKKRKEKRDFLPKYHFFGWNFQKYCLN